MVVLPSCEQQINYPAPTITSLSPSSITAGSPQSYLTVNGKNLIQQSQVGYALAPNTSPSLLATFNYVSTNQIVVTLPATLLQNPNTLYISVTTPQPGGGTYPSPNQPAPSFTIFTISPAKSGVPQITSINPTSVLVGTTNGLTLHISGANFVTQSELFVNGANRSVTYDNSTSLTAQLSATDVVNPGTLQIMVVNPSPGGGNSAPFPLNVNTAVPTISAITPTSEQAGGTANVTLTVTGTGFLNQYSSINVNGVPFATDASGGTSAAATITPSYLSQGGVDQITVVNAGPGGGPSNILTFAVNPTHLLGLPILVDLAADGSQAANGLCGGSTSCTSGALGLTASTVGPSTSNTGQYRRVCLCLTQSCPYRFEHSCGRFRSQHLPGTGIVLADHCSGQLGPLRKCRQRRELGADSQFGRHARGVHVAGDEPRHHGIRAGGHHSGILASRLLPHGDHALHD